MLFLYDTYLVWCQWCVFFFFFNDTATTEIYTLSLHDALPIYSRGLNFGIFCSHLENRTSMHIAAFGKLGSFETFAALSLNGGYGGAGVCRLVLFHPVS